MSIINLGWFDSRYKLTGIPPEQFDLGWPHCLSSADIATLQRPVPADRKGVSVGMAHYLAADVQMVLPGQWHRARLPKDAPLPPLFEVHRLLMVA